MPHKSIWDVLKQPNPKTVLTSGAPGTGPYESDTPVTRIPQARGGVLIPKPGPPDAVGYGGGGDTIVYAPSNHGAVEAHSDPLVESRYRFPTHSHLGPPRPTLPRFNTLYDSLRTTSAWTYCNDFTVNGTITPATSGVVSVAVSAPANQGLFTNRVGQFPGGIQFYLVIRTFGFGASALTMTGSVFVYFLDNSNQQVPLGILTGTQYNTDLTNVNTLLTSPITDAGITSLGFINATMTNGGTPVACTWFLTFALAYLLPDPSYNGYAMDTIPPLQEHFVLQVPRR